MKVRVYGRVNFDTEIDISDDFKVLDIPYDRPYPDSVTDTFIVSCFEEAYCQLNKIYPELMRLGYHEIEGIESLETGNTLVENY